MRISNPKLVKKANQTSYSGLIHYNLITKKWQKRASKNSVEFIKGKTK